MKHCIREKWETKVMSNSYTQCMLTKKAILTHYSNPSFFVLQCQINYLWWEWQEVKLSVSAELGCTVLCDQVLSGRALVSLWCCTHLLTPLWWSTTPPKVQKAISAWVCIQPVIFSTAGPLYFTATGFCPPGIGAGIVGHWQRVWWAGRGAGNCCCQSRIYKWSEWIFSHFISDTSSYQQQ